MRLMTTSQLIQEENQWCHLVRHFWEDRRREINCPARRRYYGERITNAVAYINVLAGLASKATT